MKVEESNFIGKKVKCPFCGTTSTIEKNDLKKEMDKNTDEVLKVKCPECTFFFPVLKIVTYFCPSNMGLPRMSREKNEAYPIEMNRV